ncbi:MAG: glycoside hydrolase family 3 C-terminal domain-containing protein [Micromonosporaceae bacterium]|nr:glycoside hydrolase family 3 C-terminal domain-containing protein [Micromonosporaceae bacterium]
MRQPATGTFADHSQPLADRVTDLLGRLTLAEKISLLHQHQAPVPRLGMRAFRTGTEALHGLAWLGPATVFPQAIGLASTWDLDLIREIGSSVGDEVRGSHRKDPSRAGLNVWAPVVNPLRDPRWGRNEEGYSEDPHLTGLIATAYAWGLRGDHPTYLRTAPTLKHFLGYNNETDRDITSSVLSQRVLHEYELPAFRIPIAAGAAVAIMASYNLVNGRPAHVTPLIKSEVRTWTRDEVLVVSDAGAPSLLAGRQGFYPDHVTSTAAALRAGMDSFTEIGSDNSVIIDRVTRAFDQGLVTESDIDAAVRRILTIRFRLGEFDPADQNPYAAIDETVINSPGHQALARRAARQAVVLLKNEGASLPLAASAIRSIAVLGPLSNTVHTDWYSGTLPYQVSVRDAISARIGEASTLHVEGIDRIALRDQATGRYMTTVGDGQLRLLPAPAPGAAPRTAGFDVFDWGRGVFSLRAANGRTVSVDDEGRLTANRAGPGGWVVRETFRLVERVDGGVSLRNEATGLDVVAAEDGLLYLAETGGPRESDLGTEGGTALGGSATAVVGGIGGAAVSFTAELLVDGIAEAAALAGNADVAIVVAGNHPMVNGRETEDRTDLELPAAQEALIRAVHAANPATILMITSSYPFGITWADEHLPAIVWSCHGGQELGNGLADVLFGDADPAGRLTQTWYRSATDLPDLLDYDVISNDMTYLYYRGTPLYPFGHGLSYTTFEYSDLRLSSQAISADETVTVEVTVANTGQRPGVEVVQLYTRQRSSHYKRPLRQLQGFRRVELAPGERATVNISLPAAQLATWNVNSHRFVVESANHQVMIGSSSADLPLAAILSVHGGVVPPRDAYAAQIEASDHSEYAGVTLVPKEQAAGDAVESTEPDGWIAFHDVDLGTGARTVRLRVNLAPGWSAPAGQPPTLALRLDNPFDGPIAGTTVIPHTGDRYRWAEVPVALAGARGIRDVYAVFSDAGIGLSTLTFGARP